MSRVATVREIALQGEVNPQELKAIQAKREAMARDRNRGGVVAALIVNAVHKTNPDHVVAEQELQAWHHGQELGFLKEAIHTDDPDQFLDAETIPVSVARLRKMARKYADLALEAQAMDARISKLRSECFEEVEDEIGRLREELAAMIAPMSVAVGSVTSQLRRHVRDNIS